MPAKNSRSGANKLSNALESYEDSINSGENINNKSKLAIKALREEFGQSLKITSQSSHEGNFLTQSIAFAINSGKFDELLAEQSLTSTLEALEKISPTSLPSRTLHSMATVEALCLMGFDVELSLPALTLTHSINAAASQSAPQAVADPVQIDTPDSSIATKEPKNDSPQIETNTPVEQPPVEETSTDNSSASTADLTGSEGNILELDDKQSDDKSPTENEENALSSDEGINSPLSESQTDDNITSSRSAMLSSLIVEQEVNEDSAEPDVKKVSPEIIGKIIESMREFDISEAATLSRLRSTTAKTIHDLTQAEGYRITNWLNASSADSSDVIKKRKKYGSFQQHIPEANESMPEAEVEADGDSASANQKQDHKPEAASSAAEKPPKAPKPLKAPKAVKAPKTPNATKPPKKAPDAAPKASKTEGNADLASGKTLTPPVRKALDSFLREKASNESAETLAVQVIKDITGIDTSPDDIADLITELEDKEAKQFRSKLSAMILINS
ncbi:hypothetical protein OTK49_00125 [Vibrio coralliirubri]|uniref:hypothetical protein n=1 Tax=Vibrio coralliirubri TaxID=1516159 RepID=UPI00228486C7|nr:hypothetical protein [Vibrio coralliirubri]MCY9860946.1 hypothetical protein [Vibrio coralliirubri]